MIVMTGGSQPSEGGTNRLPCYWQHPETHSSTCIVFKQCFFQRDSQAQISTMWHRDRHFAGLFFCLFTPIFSKKQDSFSPFYASHISRIKLITSVLDGNMRHNKKQSPQWKQTKKPLNGGKNHDTSKERTKEED